MKTLKLKKIGAVAVAAIGITALANPSVTGVTVANGDTWSSKKVSFKVSGVENWQYYLGFDVTVNGVTKTVDGGVAYNTTYSGVVIDTKEIFGELKTDENATIKVWVSKIEPTSLSHVAVQLWEDGPYWAICNVDADKPTDAGSYFWWGDTAGQKPDSNNEFSTEFRSANTPTYGKDNAALLSEGWIDSTGNLAPTHDAATQKLGASWRMPTSDEIQMLVDKCDYGSGLTTVDGVRGRIVKGRGKYASRSIFLPAAGRGEDAPLYNSGSYGYYWSSTPLAGDSYCAWHLRFVASYFTRNSDDSRRTLGYSVRAVRGFAK